MFYTGPFKYDELLYRDDDDVAENNPIDLTKRKYGLSCLGVS